MSRFDYDVVITGSGFGGSVAALRAAQKGFSVGPGDAIPNDFVVPYYLGELKRRIAVARVHDRLFAFDDLCTCGDRPCPLSGGLLTGTSLMCQCHGSRFDISTGAVLKGPSITPLTSYEVREVEGDIQIQTCPSNRQHEKE